MILIMPFSKKYSELGNTKRVRFPEDCLEHLDFIVQEYNRIKKLKGEMYLVDMKKKLEQILKDIK